MNVKISIDNSAKKLEINFDIKPTDNKPKFNPTSENKIHVEVEGDEEDKFWCFL